jgi:hypothetical protein
LPSIGSAVQNVGTEQIRVEMLRPPGRIDVIDGDTVRFEGAAYCLVGNRNAGAWRQGAL